MRWSIRWRIGWRIFIWRRRCCSRRRWWRWRVCRQPAKRLAVAKAAIVAAALLGCVVCTAGVVARFAGRSRCDGSGDAVPSRRPPPVTRIDEVPRTFEKLRQSRQRRRRCRRPVQRRRSQELGDSLVDVARGGLFRRLGGDGVVAGGGCDRGDAVGAASGRFPEALRAALSDVAGLGRAAGVEGDRRAGGARRVSAAGAVAAGVDRDAVRRPSCRRCSRTRRRTFATAICGGWRRVGCCLVCCGRSRCIGGCGGRCDWIRRRWRTRRRRKWPGGRRTRSNWWHGRATSWPRPRPLLPASVGLWEGASQLRRRVAGCWMSGSPCFTDCLDQAGMADDRVLIARCRRCLVRCRYL